MQMATSASCRGLPRCLRDLALPWRAHRRPGPAGRRLSYRVHFGVLHHHSRVAPVPRLTCRQAAPAATIAAMRTCSYRRLQLECLQIDRPSAN